MYSIQYDFFTFKYDNIKHFKDFDFDDGMSI